MDYEELNNEGRRETPEESVMRLRAEIAAGELHLRPELAESLMRSARHLAEKKSFDAAVTVAEESISITRQLIKDGQVEFRESMGRCMLFWAIMLRLARGNNAGLKAFNDVIQFISKKQNGVRSELQNELAVALMNRAEILIDPVGALSSAIASQEQAVKIWTRLASGGEPEFRHQLIAALLSCGDAKEQSGDMQKAIADYQKALSHIQVCLEEGETVFALVLLQALIKLSRLLEKQENYQGALDISAKAVALIMQLTSNGNSIPPMLLPSLYLQRGLIYEHIREPEASLKELDCCLEEYRRIEQNGQDYTILAGKANAVMCRANVLADLKRFDEASKAYREAEILYDSAEGQQLPAGEDETFLPYSKGVVQLNHANMLVLQGKLKEAVALKKQALEYLRKRFAQGHREILPNIITAYQKMVGIHRTQNKHKQTLHWINELIVLLEPIVDEGQLEYAGELATVYQLRSICLEEQNKWEAAESDLLRALRLYRVLADEETEDKFPTAKLQWGEALEHLGLFYVHQNKIETSFQTFQKVINEVQQDVSKGNEQLMFDVLHACSLFFAFAEKQLQDEERYPEKTLQKLVRTTQKAANWAIETAQQYSTGVTEQSAAMFFNMKTATFLQHRAVLSMFVKKYKKAGRDFAAAAKLWEQQDVETDKLRFKAEYYRREAGVEGEPLAKFAVNDPFRDRQLYYAKERLQVLQQQARCALILKQFTQAERIYEQSVAMVRSLISSGVSEAERMLVLTLSFYVKAVEEFFPAKKTERLYRETLKQIHHLFQTEVPFVDEDYLMLRHIYASFASFLIKLGENEKTQELLHQYVHYLISGNVYPAPNIWVDLCRVLDIFNLRQNNAQSKNVIKKLQRDILTSHPQQDDESIIQYAQELGMEQASG